MQHIVPVKEGMSLARFMNALRNDLPDIDLDLPHDQRDTIFQRLFQVERAPPSSLPLPSLLTFLLLLAPT